MSVLDLEALPAPDAVAALDFETILAACKADLADALPSIAPTLDLESEPVVKLLEVWAYRETLLRAAINDGMRAVLLATATGSMLDHLGALLGVARLIIVPANLDASPPVAEVRETDVAFRRRIQLSLEGFSVAGPREAYRFHALSASGQVRDVGVRRIGPGQVGVRVISTDADGAASPELLATVADTLSAEDVRPLCDDVVVAAADLVVYDVEAVLHLPASPGADAAMSAAEDAVRAYCTGAFAVGAVVRRSAIIAALHQAGISWVDLVSPAADIDPGVDGAARASSFLITSAVA